MTKVYFRHTKTNKKFECLKVDQEKKLIWLKGEFSEFDVPLDKEKIKEWGYVMEKEETDA